MAFGFVKKIFSFAREQAEEYAAVEERAEVRETAPPPQPSPPAPPPAAGDALPAPELETLPLAWDAVPAPALDTPAEPPQPTPAEPPRPSPVEPPHPSPAKPIQPPPAPIEVPVEPSPQALAPPLEVPPEIPSAPPPRPVPEVPLEVPEPPRPEPESPRRTEKPIDTRPMLGGVEALASSPTPAPALGKVTVAKAVERRVEAPPPALAAPRPTWFQRMRQGLSRSSRELGDNLSGIFTKGRLTEEIIDELEEVLIRADLGMETAVRVTGALESGRYGRTTTEADVRAVMAAEVEKVLGPVALPLELDLSHKPHVILVVGVNGTGKTTTIGKLAAKLTAGGLSVMLAAGDTFRAAAIEQLKIWGERTNSPVVASKLGADAAGLAYDAFEKARADGADVLIIDTAGRLQNKAELMAELEKIVRVLARLDPGAPHTVLQTVDATTGQNALNQVEIFRNVAGVNGLVITKLDGTARGGILVAIAAKHKLPVYFIGVGEQVDDLEPFSARDFARAIAGIA